jgi:hypothetical protein
MRRLSLLVLAASQSRAPAAPATPTALAALPRLAVPPGRVGAVQVAVADVHSCARMSDGTVRCAGGTASGTLPEQVQDPK